MDHNEEFISVLDKFLLSQVPLQGDTSNLFREVQHRYSASKLDECLRNPYFRCLIQHYYFETDLQAENHNLKIAMEMIQEKCRDCDNV